MIVKYRHYLSDEVIPKKIKVKIPGWAGQPGYSDPSPWHCKPFMDACQYGFELVYPFKENMVVKRVNGEITFESKDKFALNYIDKFAPNYYSISSFLDLSPPEGFLTRIEPHPRFYTDTNGTCPIAVAGHLKRFWTRVFFVVFKSPLEGQTHLFSYGEPYASLLFIPENSEFDLQVMNKDEIKNRENLESFIHEKGQKLCTHSWVDSKGNNFNNKYKVLNKIYEKKGVDFIFSFLRIFKKVKIKNTFVIPKKRST